MEGESTLKELIIKWLERTPFFDEQYWADYASTSGVTENKFWTDYRVVYQGSLSDSEGGRLKEFDKVFLQDGRGDLSPKAMQAALFITLYRDLPVFQLPFELLNTLSEIDELLSNWRYRKIA